MIDQQKELIGKRSQLFRKLLQFRDIIPGAISERKITCSTKTCKCHTKGEKHTAFQYFYKLDAEKKGVTKMIPKDLAYMVQKQVQLNKDFKKMVKLIYEINLKILFAQIQDRKTQKKD